MTTGAEILDAVAAVFHAATDFFSLDPARIRFEAPLWALGVAAAIMLVALAKGVLGKDLSHRKHSGLRRLTRDRKRPFARMLHGLPKIIAALAIPFVLFALAIPYEERGYSEQKRQSRDVCYLLDASGSAAFEFAGSGRSLGEVARSALVDFIVLRAPEKDRSCGWIFSVKPYKVEDFVVDPELFAYQMYQAPWVLAGSGHPLALMKKGYRRGSPPPGYYPETWESFMRAFGDSPMPLDRVQEIDGEGGTELSPALVAVASDIGHGSLSDTLAKALIIMTDAAVTRLPDKEFDLLSQRNIIPFLIFIQPNREKLLMVGVEGEAQLPNVEPLLRAIQSHGGQYYEIPATGEYQPALRAVFADINRRLPKHPTIEMHYAERVYVHDRALAIAFIVLCAAAVLGIVAEVRLGRRI